MRKLLILCLIVAVLCISAAAYEAPVDFTGITLEEAVADLMEYYQLSENNFSMSYYNTVTGESYDFNENKFSIAASTYKLPLNMCFYEMEQAGKIDPNETFRWTGMSLSEVHRQSILFSNNEVSEAMIGYWNNYYIYKENMRKYSTMPLEDIDESFYLTNTSCTRLMIDTLKYLYANSDRFEELIGYMKDAMPGQYFQAGVQEYEVAHKYGEINEFVNDVAIFYTPQPFLLAVYTQGIHGTGVCAQAARLMTNYTVWKGGNAAVTVPEEAVPVGGEEVLLPEKTPVEETPIEETHIEETPIEETPVEETPVEETPVEETPEEETPVEETPVEETPVEETPAEEEPVEEAPSEEETQQEEEPSEETEEDQRRREQEERKLRKQRKKKVTWTIVGIGSVLMLVAIPIIMRRRLY